MERRGSVILPPPKEEETMTTLWQYASRQCPWDDGPDYTEDDFWDRVDDAYEAKCDGTMRATHGHAAEERAAVTAMMEDIQEKAYV